MGLQCGIVGLSKVGKTTLFNCLSNTRAETSGYKFESKANIGIITVPDDRLQELEKLQPTEKVIPATVDIVDIPGLTKSSEKGEGSGNQLLADIRNTDAIVHVLRCFESESLPHQEGSVDPLRDKEIIDFELQLKDIESIEKKITRFEKVAKTGDKDAKQGIAVLKKYKEHLESFNNARTLEVKPEEKQYIDDLFLLTMKPVLFVCNVDEAAAKTGNKYSQIVEKELSDSDAQVLVIAAELEAEIADLEDAQDRKAFLEDAGLNEPGVNKLVRSSYDLLNLQTFFTIGPKENRAWTIKKGMTAPEAAGVIHTDLKRGFIRAEVMSYKDFIECGSETACRDAGKLRIEGKKYIVKDGDILHIRFNV